MVVPQHPELPSMLPWTQSRCSSCNPLNCQAWRPGQWSVAVSRIPLNCQARCPGQCSVAIARNLFETGRLLSTLENTFLGFGLCFGQCPSRLQFPAAPWTNPESHCGFSGHWKHPDRRKRIALCSGLLKSNTLTFALLPQALLRSLFPELSSTWFFAFFSLENQEIHDVE